MNILVRNCFHWIGFHIVNRFILNGNHVVGLNDHMTDRAEFLSFFLGRNSLFTLVDQTQAQYDLTVIVNDDKDRKKLLLKRKGAEILTTIQTPLLFGEWMKMDENGIFIANKHIPFKSDKFLTQAIHIDDFTKSLNQWIKSTHLPAHLKTQSSRDVFHKDVILDNSIYIRDNIPIERKVNDLKDHYKRFNNYYHLYH